MDDNYCSNTLNNLDDDIVDVSVARTRIFNPFVLDLLSEIEKQEVFHSTFQNLCDFLEVCLDNKLTQKEKEALLKASLILLNRDSRPTLNDAHKILLNQKNKGNRDLDRLINTLEIFMENTTI